MLVGTHYSLMRKNKTGNTTFNPNRLLKRREPRIVVTGGDSWPDGRGLEYQHHIMDGHFSHIFVKKLEKMKINKKEARDGPF